MKHKFILFILFILFIGFVNASLTDDILLYYKLDEQDTTGSGTIYDAVGTYDGTNGGADNTTGKINTAYDFEANDNDLINITSKGVVPTGANADFCFNAWIKIESESSGNEGRTIISQYVGGQAGRFIFSTHYDETVGGLRWWSSGGEVIASDVNVSDGNWHMVTATRNSGNVSLYINGIYEDSTTDTTALLDSYSHIGFADVNWKMDGVIDEVYIRNASCSADDVSELWNDGNGNQYPFAVDTCSCPGAGNNWEIDMSDYCNITSDCDLTTGKLSFTGSGETRVSATIKTTDLGDPGANGILKILSDCLIWIN